MTLTQLEYFVEIVEAGNFTKAANKIFVSQPTLSRTVQNLEKELGTILIDRDSKDLELTKDGEIFYHYASDVLSVVNAKTIEMRDKLGNSDGVIRLGITPTTGAMYFHSAIYEFHKKYPVADLQIEEVTTRKGLDMLLDGQLDLSVDIDPTESEDFIKLPVIKSEAVLIVPKEHRLAKRSVVSFSELKGENMMMVGKGYTYYDIACEKLREAGIEPDFTFESSQWEFIFELVANGQGVSILPKPLVDKFINSRVRQVRLEKPRFIWCLYLVRKKGRKMSTEVECFWNMCTRGVE